MPTPLGYSDLRAEDLERIRSNQFETFLFELVRWEAESRHDRAKLDGPSRPSVADGGSDVAIIVKAVPHTSLDNFQYALTLDAIGTHRFSCKTGPSWKKEIRRDFRRTEMPLRTVREGGSVTVVINLPVGEVEGKNLLTDLAKTLSKRSRDGDGPEILESQARKQLALIDATTILSFLRWHRPPLSQQFRSDLNLSFAQDLVSFDPWKLQLSQERSLPEFQADEPRSKFIEQIRSALEAPSVAAQVLWVSGRPGVGKTRLVLETIEDAPNLKDRVLFAAHPSYATRAIVNGLLKEYPEVILVVDECSPEQVSQIVGLCAGQQEERARILLIGPMPGEPAELSDRITEIRLDPLEKGACLDLIRSQLPIIPEDDLVDRIYRLSEGYPWFSTLIARAVGPNPSVLPVTSSQWDAAKLAIAGPGSDFSTAWRDHAKALFAILITEQVDWQRSDGDLLDKVAAVLDLSWSRIVELAEECRRRGIVREELGWRLKYVTPNILARLVAEHFLGPPFWLGRKIREQIPGLHKRLLEKLEFLQVDQSFLKELAAEELATTEKKTLDISGIGEIDLRFASRWQPGATARLIRRLVGNATIEQLTAARRVRRDLVFSLAHIVHRQEGFQDAEEALFRLALAETESYWNNATGVWKSVFLAALSLTHRPFEQRFAILQGRLESRYENECLLAVEGLVAAAGEERTGMSYDDDDLADGKWPEVTLGEYQEAKCKAWPDLIRAADHRFEAVARMARQAIPLHLHAVPAGCWPDIATQLCRSIPSWTAEQRGAIRESLERIRRASNSRRQDPDNVAAMVRLELAAAPLSYHDRLVDQIGHWHYPEPSQDRNEFERDEADADKALAIEGLAQQGAPILAELDWLQSPEAVRAIPFLLAVGSEDSEEVLLRHLIRVAATRSGADLLAAYSAGRREHSETSWGDALMRLLQGSQDLALARLLVAWRLGDSDVCVAAIVEDLRAGLLDGDATECLQIGRFGSRVSRSTALPLIRELLATGSTKAAASALAIIEVQIKEGHSSLEDSIPQLLDVLRVLAEKDLAPGGAYSWSKGVELVLSGADAESRRELVTIAGSALAHQRRHGTYKHVWELIKHLSQSNPVSTWEEIGRQLLLPSGYRLSLEAQSEGIVPLFPEQTIISWIGDDTERARAVARVCSAHESPLNNLARQLLVRFGADGPPASELTARAHSSQRVIVGGGLSQFYGFQVANARNWASDPEREVARWGRRMLESFEKEFKEHKALETFASRRDYDVES